MEIDSLSTYEPTEKVEALLQRFDWEKTGPGKPADWHPLSKSIIKTMIQTADPAAVLLGKDLLLFYNDAFIPFLEEKHPQNFGASVQGKNDTLMKVLVEQLKGIYKKNENSAAPFQIEFKNGFSSRPIKRTLFFSPTAIRSESNELLGIYLHCREVTTEIIREKFRNTIHELNRLASQAGSPGELLHSTGEFLHNTEYFHQWLVYELTSDGHSGTLIASAGDQVDESWQSISRTTLFNALTAFRSGECVYEMAGNSVSGLSDKLRTFVFMLSDVSGSRPRYLQIVRAQLDPNNAQFYIDFYRELSFQLRAMLAMQHLRAMEEQKFQDLRRFLVKAPVAIFMVTGPSLKFELINDCMLALIGRRSDEILYKPFAESFPDAKHNLLENLQEVYRFGRRYVSGEIALTISKNDGNNKVYVKFLFEPVKDDNGFVAGVIGVAEDINEQVRAREVLEEEGTRLQELVDERNRSLQKINEDLQQSEERFHKMTEEVQDYAILLLDPDGYILNWNSGARKIKGYTESEILSQNFRRFYTPEDRDSGLPEKLLKEARETGRAAQEGWRVRKDGTRFWASVIITALHDSKNNLIGFSKVTRDLTERKLAEDKLKQYTIDLENQNVELEQFAYVASHDLQEPLRKIRTFLDLMKHNLQNPEAALRYFEKIEGAAIRMSELIRSILSYSRLSVAKAEFTDVDLNEVLKEALTDLELVIQEKKAKINSDQLPVIKGSMPQLHQLFLNLIGNALKFNTGSPIVEIHCTPIERALIPHQEKIADNRNYYLIVFKDNGIGFEQKYAEQVFTIFQRLHSRDTYSGTGIGLAICRRIVDNHHGLILAKSEAGKGAEFQVYLPQ